MWTTQMQPPRVNLTQSTTSKPVFASPMTEDSIEKTAQRVQSSLRDLGIIVRELLKGSRSEEVLSSAAKSFVQTEGHIDNCALNIARLELLTKQIALHEECMEQSLSNVEDLQWKLNNLTSLAKKAYAHQSIPAAGVVEALADLKLTDPPSQPEAQALLD